MEKLRDRIQTVFANDSLGFPYSLSYLSFETNKVKLLKVTTVFVDTRLWKTKHPRKRFQNFRQSYVLLTDRIEIHQLQPLVWPSNLLYVMLSGCDWWISIRSVNNMQDWRKFWFPFCFSKTDFDRYTITLNRRMRLARHIGFVIYFKIAQTYILRYYSTYCKTNGNEK